MDKKKGFDICSLANALAFGTLVFVVLYTGRRAHNRWKRRDVTRNVNDSPSVSDIDNGIPEHLPWELDHSDRDLIRAALLSTGIALLFCYFKKRQNAKTSSGEWDMSDDVWLSPSESPSAPLSELPSAPPSQILSSFDYRYANNPEFRASVDNANPEFVQFARRQSAAWDNARGPSYAP
jgi:hypothetical protein